jgi:hypothetical protein
MAHWLFPNAARSLLLATLLTVPFCCFAAADPFTGTWKLDTTRTKTSPVTAPPVIRIEAEAAGMAFIQHRPNANREPYDLKLRTEFDGKVTGVIDSPEVDALKCWRSDSHTILMQFLRGGTSFEWQTLEVSKNGKTLKVTWTLPDANGKETKSAAFYEKQ